MGLLNPQHLSSEPKLRHLPSCSRTSHCQAVPPIQQGDRGNRQRPANPRTIAGKSQPPSSRHRRYQQPRTRQQGTQSRQRSSAICGTRHHRITVHQVRPGCCHPARRTTSAEQLHRVDRSDRKPVSRSTAKSTRSVDSRANRITRISHPNGSSR